MKKIGPYTFLLVLIPAAICGALYLHGPAKESYTNIQTPERAESQKEARILFVGDMMFDRTIRKHGDKRGYDYIFSCVHEYLAGFDGVLGNLEGPITEHGSYSLATKPGEPGNTTFTFDPIVAETLVRNNIRIVNIGNNHITDFGQSGVESTRSILDKAGVISFGAPLDDGKSILATSTVGGVHMAFVNFNQFSGQDHPGQTVEAIRKARGTSDIIAVYAHWGEEYLPATEYEKILAHRFIDAGADIVIGSHPHIVQEIELYKGKYIYYSLGNFIFDQYFSEYVKRGKGVELLVRNGTISIQDSSFDLLPDGRTCVTPHS